ncbi:FMN-linked oxidoreductase [Penicillium lividum]|nr:FMN-linked oxidoreductase [Penicillium lividum]
MKSAFSDVMHYPIAMKEDEIRGAISDFVNAAENATLAGFDGVEIHGANGGVDQGSDRTAIRLSPWSRYQGMRLSDPIPQFSHVVRRLAEFKLAYLHVCESDVKDEGPDWLLKAYGNASPVLLAGNYNGESAKVAVDTRYASHDIAIAFGRPYIANPDLPFKVKKGLPFAPFHPQTMYGQSSEGYIDYPFSEEFKADQKM